MVDPGKVRARAQGGRERPRSQLPAASELNDANQSRRLTGVEVDVSITRDKNVVS
jgi:hypothetical protein